MLRLTVDGHILERMIVYQIWPTMLVWSACNSRVVLLVINFWESKPMHLSITWWAIKHFFFHLWDPENQFWTNNLHLLDLLQAITSEWAFWDIVLQCHSAGKQTSDLKITIILCSKVWTAAVFPTLNFILSYFQLLICSLKSKHGFNYDYVHCLYPFL